MTSMNMPGFTAENSICKTTSLFRSEADRSFGSRKVDNQAYLQVQKDQGAVGDRCHASSSSGTINAGTYDSSGNCCGPKLSNGSQFCINCSNPNNTCGDGHSKFTHLGDFFRVLSGNSMLMF